MATNHKFLVNLRNVLAELYPDGASIQRIAWDAEIDLTRINFHDSPIGIWHSMLLEAANTAKLEDIVEIVKQDYPANTDLKTAYEQYLESVKNKGRNLAGAAVKIVQFWSLLTGLYIRNKLSEQNTDLEILKNCTGMGEIRNVYKKFSKIETELSTLDDTMLRDFCRISEAVDTAFHQHTSSGQRLALSNVDDRLDKILRELFTNRGKYHSHFYPAAEKWKQIISSYLRKLMTDAEVNGEIDNPYVINLPLTLEQEIFVGRVEVASQIERLLLNRQRPPLLVYGQRRMGKTSLLKNLSRLLPETVIPLYVDLQGPATKSDNYAGFLYNIARGMVDSAYEQRRLSLPPLPREALQSDPFTYFDEWLDEVEQWLGLKDTALLMLDEFETLDKAIMRGRYDEEDVLGMLRHMIQHRPRFRILLAGSHTLEEYQRWSSYLINVEAVHLSYLTREEAIQLIERPVPEFPLQYEPAARERILELTRCHPFLIQLLCAELVELKNEQAVDDRRIARVSDIEAAIPEALQTGSFYAGDIKRNQIDECGRTILHYLAAQGEGGSASFAALKAVCSDDLENALYQLTQRELIELTDDGYRFQVELIRRWFLEK